MSNSPGTDEPLEITGVSWLITIKTTRLLKILGDPEFYLACPEYFFMRDPALLIIERWHEGDLAHPAQSLQIPLETFVRHTVAMQEAFGNNGPESVFYFFQKVLGYQATTFVVYYKRGQQEPQELHFHPEQGGSDGNTRNHAQQVGAVPSVCREPG